MADRRATPGASDDLRRLSGSFALPLGVRPWLFGW